MTKKTTKDPIQEGREHIAKIACEDGEHQFAREVLAGCWDHRTDVASAIEGKRFKSFKARKATR